MNRLNIVLLLLLLLSARASSAQNWPSALLRIKEKGWIMVREGNRVTFVKKDSITINCCVLNPVYNDDEPDSKYAYFITLEQTEPLSLIAMEKRRTDQKTIEDSLKKSEGQLLTYGRYHHFFIQKNSLDSLRIPVISNPDYSVFVYDKVEQLGFLNGYFKHEEEFEEIIEMREKIFKALSTPYLKPSWYYEYVPFRLDDRFKGK